VGLVNSTNITVKNLNLTNNGHGIQLIYTNDSTIENTSISNNKYGIYLSYSCNNTITRNNVSNNYYGVYLNDSPYNNIARNTVKSCVETGITLDYFPAPGPYLPPVGFGDPDDEWIDEPLAYDEDLDTYAKVYVPRMSSSSYLELLTPTEKSQGIRFWLDPGSKNYRPQIDLFYDGGWNLLVRWGEYSTPPPSGEWVEVDYPQEILTKTIEKARISFTNYGFMSGGYVHLSEFQFKTTLNISSSNNNIVRNTVSKNGVGIRLYHSSGNRIYLNNFINNTDNGYSKDSSNTCNSPWEITYTYNGSTYTSYLGNYWSDYGAYLPPVGFDDPDDEWIDEPLAYDENRDTYAKVYVGASASSWLELTAPSEETQGIRFWVNKGALRIEIHYDGHSDCLGDWDWPYSYAPSNEWVEVSYPSKTIEKARIRFNTGMMGGYWGRLYEFQFKPTPSNYSGSDADRDGIGDTPYSIDGDNDYYPLIEPFESYDTNPAFTENLWPMFQHDAQHTGRISLAGPGSVENPEINMLAGGSDTDYFYTPVIGSDGSLYFKGRINGNEGIYAFTPDGTEKWYYPSLLIYTSSPTVAYDGSIYFYVCRERYYNVSLIMLHSDGTLKWEKTLLNAYPYGYPAIDNNGIIYFSTLYNGSVKLIAQDPDSGDFLWVYETHGYKFPSAPAVGQNGVIYFGAGDTLFAINPNGTEKWQRSFPAIFLNGSQILDQTTVGTPSIADDGTVYILVGKEVEWGSLTAGGWYTGLHAIDPKNSYQEKWVRYIKGTLVEKSPTIDGNGNIYIAGGCAPAGDWSTTLYGFNSQGNNLENWPLNLGYVGRAESLIADKEGIIYGIFGSHSVKAFDQYGNQKWSLQVYDSCQDYPLSIGKNGTLYVPGRKWLYAISSETGNHPPVVNSLSVTPSEITIGSGQPFTISYTVSDDKGLERVELWRAKSDEDPGEGSPLWEKIKTQDVSGTSYSDSFTDSPSSLGIYWYGIHVIDKAGQCRSERDYGKGPIKVMVVGNSCITPPSYFSLSKVNKVIDWAENQKDKTNWYGYCTAFVQDSFKTYFRFGSANALMNYLIGSNLFCSDKSVIPPTGTLVFFSAIEPYKKYGHVGISVGDGKVIHSYDKVRTDSINTIENLNYIDSYLGWAYPPKEWFYQKFSNNYKKDDYIIKEDEWNLRDMPTTYGNIITKVGGEGIIVEDEYNGICNGRHYWWHIRYKDANNNEHEGWCAEEGIVDDTERNYVEEEKLENKINTLLESLKSEHLPLNLLDENVYSWWEKLGWGAIVTWKNFKEWIMNEYDQYYDFYNTGVKLHYDSIISLEKAKKFLENGDIESAKKYLDKGLSYRRASIASFDGAWAVFMENADETELALKTIHDACKIISLAGLSAIAPPVAADLEKVYIAVDFWADYETEGLNEATKNVIISIIIDNIFNKVTISESNGKTIKQYIEKSGRDVSFDLIRKAMKSQKDEVSGEILRGIGKYTSQIAKDDIEKLIDKIVDEYLKELKETIEGKCPISIRVYNSKGNITGLINGNVKQDVPLSFYCNNTITIFFPNDTYVTEVVGTDNGTYGLDITSVENGTSQTFARTNVSISTNVTHRYIINWSTYESNFQIDSDGDGIFEHNITLQPPVASFVYTPINPVVNQVITFNASSSYDPDGDILNYTWQFGDGTIGYGENPTHQYIDDGTYLVNLMVTDNDGVTDIIQMNVTVSNIPPVANFSYSPSNPTDLDTIQFTDLSYDLDGSIINYTWQFGDGSISYEKNPSHKYADDGIYNVTLIVKDDDGATASVMKQVIVLPGDTNPPVTQKEIGNPKYSAYITSFTPIYLNASDNANGSGVNYTHYEIWWDSDGDGIIDTQVANVTVYDNDANDLNPTIGNISVEPNFMEQCLHELRWFSIDNAGNVENVTNQTHYVDNTPPNISKQYGKPYYMNNTGAEYITSNTPIYINASDNRSAPCIVGSVHVNVSIYSFLTESWTYYEWDNCSDLAEINEIIYLPEECKHWINITAWDDLGNVAYHNQTVFVDNMPPDITKEFGKPYYMNNTGAEYITSNTPIYINASDNRSAPCIVGSVHVNVSIYSFLTESWTYYEWDNCSDLAEINEIIYLPEECKHWINITAWDDLNNTAYLNQTVFVDNMPPDITKEFGKPYYMNNTGAEYITSNTPIYINASDNRSAPCIVGSVHVNVSIYSFLTESWTYYEWDNCSDLATINEIIYLPEECKHWINITAWDDLGNVAYHNQTVYVDNSPPNISKQYGKPYYNDGTNEWITTSTPVYLNASDYPDCACGVREIHYNYGSGWIVVNGSKAVFTIPDECHHVIQYYAVDNLGNNENMKTTVVNVDNTPPETTLTFGTPYHYDGNNWITTSTPITLSAVDYPDCACGVNHTYYRIITSSYTTIWYEYTQPFTMPEECEHTIEYYSIDHIGNIENVKSIIIYVDDSPPLINVEVGEPHINASYVTSDTPIDFDVIDTGCNGGVGVDTIYYRIWHNGWSAWNEYTETITLPEEGKHYLEINATDLLGNNAYVNKTFIVDNTPPNSWMTMEMYYKQYITPWTEFSIYADEQGCCLNGYIIHFAISGPEGSKFYYFSNYYNCNGTWHTGFNTTPVSFQIRNENGYAPPGLYTVKFYAVDSLGNSGDIITETFRIDDSPPETTISLDGPSYEEWISPNTQIALISHDGGSGTMVTKYRIDNGPEKDYTEPFTLSNGMHIIHYYSIDNMGNKESEHTATLYVDANSPDSQISFNGKYVSGKTTWITKDTSIVLNANDVGCGLKAIYYRIDGGDWNEYSTPITLNNGIHKIEYYGMDNVENKESVKTINVGIDTAPPQITIDTPKPSYIYILGRQVLPLPGFMHVDAIIIGSVKIKASASDECGISDMKLYIDDKLVNEGSSIDYNWNEISFTRHVIKVEAKDKLGNEISKEMNVLLINFRI